MKTCIVCGKKHEEEFGYANEFFFCSKEHQKNWLQERAFTLMSEKEKKIFCDLPIDNPAKP